MKMKMPPSAQGFRVDKYVRELPEDFLGIELALTRALIKASKANKGEVRITNDLLGENGLLIDSGSLEKILSTMAWWHREGLVSINTLDSESLSGIKDNQRAAQQLLYGVIGRSQKSFPLIKLNQPLFVRFEKALSKRWDQALNDQYFPQWKSETGEIFFAIDNKPIKLNRGETPYRIMAAFWDRYPGTIDFKTCGLQTADDMHKQVSRMRNKLAITSGLLEIMPVGEYQYQLVIHRKRGSDKM